MSGCRSRFERARADAGPGGRSGGGRARDCAGGGARRARGDRRRSRFRDRHRHVVAQQRSDPCRPLLPDRVDARLPLPAHRRMLYDFCASHGVPHRKSGKLVVATNDSETEQLCKRSYKQAQINGVEGVEIIDGAAARRMEPALACVAAMNSPETGIIDSHRYMLALEGDLEDHGGMIALNTRIERLVQAGRLARCISAAANRLIRSMPWSIRAGLGAQKLAPRHRGLSAGARATAVLAKGNYFSYCGPAGVLAADLSGADPRRARHARDARPCRAHALRPRCRVDRRRELRCRSGARGGVLRSASATIGQACRTTALVPDYAGIRPKISGQGEPAADFMIDAPADHGVPRLVQLFGIESPGLTASLRSPRRWSRSGD